MIKCGNASVVHHFPLLFITSISLPKKKIIFLHLHLSEISAECTNTVKLQTVTQVVAASVQMLAELLILIQFI